MAGKHSITELEGRLSDFAGGLGDTEKLLGKIALAALARSQKRTHVLTGNLRRTETTRVERDRAFLGSSAVYARVVHEKVNPYFEEGIQDAVPQIIDLTRDWAEETFDKKVAR